MTDSMSQDYVTRLLERGAVKPGCEPPLWLNHLAKLVQSNRCRCLKLTEHATATGERSNANTHEMTCQSDALFSRLTAEAGSNAGIDVCMQVTPT